VRLLVRLFQDEDDCQSIGFGEAILFGDAAGNALIFLKTYWEIGPVTALLISFGHVACCVDPEK